MAVRTGSAAAVRLEGFSAIARAMKAGPEVTKKARRIVIRRAAYRARREEREIVPGRTFDESIRTDIRQDRATVGSLARSAPSVAAGRPPGQPPSLKALRRWIRTYGMAGAVDVRTRRAVGAKQADERVAGDMAWRFQELIRSRGTKAIAFVEGAVQPTLDDMQRYAREAIGDVAKRLAGKR